MIASHSAAGQRAGRRLLISLASTSLLASGCANLVGTAPSSGIAGSAAQLNGRVHGGNQPVAAATVNLYFAGQAGTASPATLVATTKTSSDGTGSFTFNKLANGGTNTGTTNSFSCPTTGGTPYVYVVARGGNTLNDGDSTKNNTAAVFIAPVGLCTAITASTFTYMSEAVTAATVAAVHQYMNEATGDIGADSILASYDGLQNAFNTVSNMVSLSTGQTLASVPQSGTLSGITVTATPEQAKLNQVANILSSCVNNAASTATACATLFANAVPPTSATTTSTPGVTFSAATDVLQAAYYMFTNPTDLNPTNLTKLYNLSPATGAPYQPTLSAVPSDWSIAISYVASGTCGTGTNRFIFNPYDLNVDGQGNVWISNNQPGGSALSEITSTGIPVTCQAIAGASHGGTIDSNGNIWVGDFENSVLRRFDPTGVLPPVSFPTPTPPFAVTADGTGNIFYSTLTQPSVWEIPAGAIASAAVAPVQISTNVGSTPARILVDGNNAIWASSRDAFVSLITPAVPGTAGILNGYVTTHVTTPSPSYGIAATFNASSPNGIYISSQEGANVIDEIVGSGTNYSTAPGFPTAANAGGLNVPSTIAVDGAQNVWAANDQVNTGSGLSEVSEFNKAGVSLSLDGSVAGGFQKAPTLLVHGRTIVIDQGGNVWIGNDGSSGITEIVGGGVPVFQPFAVGLKQHRFQTTP